MIYIEREYYNYFCCPKCRSSLNLIVEEENRIGIKKGNLVCKICPKSYQIINYIPRFVKQENYALNFGFQWNKFSNLRSDKYNKTNVVRNTILSRTGWNEDYIKEKLLLECGCGAGNDTEVLLDLGAKIIAFDYSNSVESALLNNIKRPNLLIFQGDLYKLPLKDDLFDFVFCHRMIQHTPDPENAFYSMIKKLKRGGEIFLHSYSLSSWNLLHYHYILRHITKRINFFIVFKFLEFVGPVLYRLVRYINTIKKPKIIKELLRRIIPFDNLDHNLENSRLTKKEKYYFSLFHVFDRLTPKYDNPNSPKTILKWFKHKKLVNINIRNTDPVIITAHRAKK